jgi:uncharacterized protein (DUF58 family)
VVVDLRSNMHFATRGYFKSVTASRAGAMISWAAHHRGDRLGGLIFGDRSHRELRPRLGRLAALRYLHELAEHRDWPDPANVHPAPDEVTEAAMTQAMAALRRVSRPGSLVVIISDFTGLTRTGQAYIAGIARHSEVLAVMVSDPLERELPPPGRYRLVSESEEASIDTYSKAARDDYCRQFDSRQQAHEQFFHRYGVHVLPLSTDDDTVECLQQALGRRDR